MNALPFVAIELKQTHHVLGVLSRDADSDGGGDIALLAPEFLTVRGRRVFASDVFPPSPPVEMQVPVSLLNAVVVKNSTVAQRRQVFSDPLNCVVADDGSAAPLASGAPVATVALTATGSVVPKFTITIPSNAGSQGLPFSVVIQQIDPPPDQPPFRCITEGKIDANQNQAVDVQITLVPGSNPTLNPIPKGVPVYVMAAVAGHALSLTRDPNP
ncbi:hypothetical protein V1279_007581 [Bradyrhizobium sp. AZCC 1610]|uniref:hypothetical protein n=1 Tax=Bradyrhizobium sp. AZCC 1610 TaxID=3117020 RepID=UPI002FF4363B